MRGPRPSGAGATAGPRLWHPAADARPWARGAGARSTNCGVHRCPPRSKRPAAGRSPWFAAPGAARASVSQLDLLLGRSRDRIGSPARPAAVRVLAGVLFHWFLHTAGLLERPHLIPFQLAPAPAGDAAKLQGPDGDAFELFERDPAPGKHGPDVPGAP